MRRISLKGIIRFALAMVGLLAAVVVATPLGRYLVRAAWEEGKILSRRRPIAGLLADPSTPEGIRGRLRLVSDARTFAVESLGLSAGESFTTFAQLDRDTLVLVLSAAYRDRLEAYRWWFPVVGRLPYKGFFRPGDAIRARDGFQGRGFDTYLRPASAFSTLGWFNDPLLSTTLRGDTTWLANTVIHELSHNTLFVKGNAEFSESFASFIGARGAEAFFLSRGALGAAREVVLDWSNDQLLGQFWQGVAASLDSAYGAWPSDSAARVVARDSVYARARRELLDRVAPLLHGIPVARLEVIPLDNAALLSRRVYAQQLDLFDSVWVRNGRDLRRTVSAIRSAVEGSARPFEELLKAGRPRDP